MAPVLTKNSIRAAGLVAEKKKDKYVYYHCTGNKGKCPEPYTREEVLEECFGNLLKGLVFDDEVMDWVSEALHQSHADQKRFRDEAIARLQVEHSKIQNRLDKLYEDRLDGFVEPTFFERKSREWRQAQKRLMDQSSEHQSANHNYVDDGVRLLELAKRAYFLFKKQNSSEKPKLLDFACSNSTWKHGTLTPIFRQPFDLLAVTNTAWQNEKAAGATSSDLRPFWLPNQGQKDSFSRLRLSPEGATSTRANAPGETSRKGSAFPRAAVAGYPLDRE